MFVCGWCAFKCLTRTALDFHFAKQRECRNNRYVNSATSQKHMSSGEIVYPGEETLDLVASKRGPGLHIVRW